MDRPLRPAALALLWPLVLCCAAEPSGDRRPLVVVSVLPQSYLVERIAGGRVRVEVMVPPGANPTSWEPSIRQLRAVSSASLYLRLGHPHFAFEDAWLDPLLDGATEVPVVDLSAGIDAEDGDPHLWLAPRYARVMARAVHAALGRLLPGDAAALDENLAGLDAEMAAVDAELRALLAAKRGASFLVFHPAWGHFAREYGLEQLAIEEDGKQPDARRLARLLERARSSGIRVVFAQPQFDPSSAKVIAAELGAELEWIDPLALDWPANLRHVAGRVAEAARP